MSDLKAAHVEIVSPLTTSGPLVPTKVFINGTDVGLIAADGVSLDQGSYDTPTRVTLTLLPGRVTIRHREAEDEADGLTLRPEPPDHAS